MAEISAEILLEFKERMKLGDDEDGNLKRILSASNFYLMRLGNFDINTDESFKELVFERSRYAYNDSLEFFIENFRTEINDLIVDKALEEIELEVDENGDPI